MWLLVVLLWQIIGSAIHSITFYQLFPCLLVLLWQTTGLPHTISAFSVFYSGKQLISLTPSLSISSPMSFTQTFDQPHISSAFSTSFKVNPWAVEVWQTTDQPHTLSQYQLFLCLLLWQTTDQPHTIINFFHEFYSDICDKQLISHTPYQLFP